MHRCKAKSSPPCLRSQHTASAKIDILKSGLKFPQIVIVVMLFYCQWKNMVVISCGSICISFAERW